MSWLFHRWLVVFGISLFVFKDSQSLFLRHVQSGKCITAEGLVYDNGGYSLPYWTIMTENCLDVNAQFRYLDSEILYNIGKDGTFVSADANRNYQKRLVIYKFINPRAKAYQNNDIHRLKQRATGTLYFYNEAKICSETSQTDYYVKGVKTCEGKPEQNFTFGALTEYNARMENVGCSKIQHMMIQAADYGNYDNNGTFNNNAAIDTQCSKLTNCQVKSLCGGNRSCELTMDNNLLPSQYCSDTSKQVYTKYTCVDTYSSSAITAAPKIRLTNRNAAFIEINDGSTWRRVVEENWDQNRQKMLCQHLGFEEINGNKIETRRLGSGQQIASGDLICYNTQSSGTSCCAHLEPSTSTTSIRIPYVRCKICNNPLLHNATAFPDSVFSGSGDSSNKYKDARITKGGWCPSESGSTYLLLDLQKQYHVTQAVVMADKKQTKWSGSYSLKYSHDTSYKNMEPILGNQNSYQASRTSLDIYNVRYVKIESTGNQDFCLRIELCGEVQTPAPVSNINVSPSNYSAYVTWQISTSTKDSSYITKIIIYLNSKEHKNISRGTQVTIDGLLPYTSYTVGIETQDGSSQKSNIVIETFKTSKAEPANPVAISYFSLNVSIAKQEFFIKEVMIIVQIASKTPTPVEDIQTNDLKPFQANTQDLYITAYFKADVLPLKFVIGDGKEYKFENERYINHPLKQNSSYIVFLRFFETKDSYYSTEWSSSVETMMKPLVKCPDSEKNAKQSNREEIRIDFIIPLVILVFCFLLSLGVIIYQRRLIQSYNGQKCRKASERAQQMTKFDSLSNKKRAKDIKASPKDLSNVTNDVAVYELPDSECTEQDRYQVEPEISTGQESPTYMSLKDSREPENVYQSLQPKKDKATVEYENPAFNGSRK